MFCGFVRINACHTNRHLLRWIGTACWPTLPACWISVSDPPPQPLWHFLLPHQHLRPQEIQERLHTQQYLLNTLMSVVWPMQRPVPNKAHQHISKHPKTYPLAFELRRRTALQNSFWCAVRPVWLFVCSADKWASRHGVYC